MKLLVLGASGLVGKNALKLALAHSAITGVVAPSRHPLPVHSKLSNPVSRQLESLLPEVGTWKVDSVICALGTTMSKAGSKEAFRQVDYALPLAFARMAHQSAAEAFAIVSATGASTSSSFFYLRTKGEVERDIASVGFKSLTILRPGIIGGKREESRFAESIGLRFASILAPVLPKRFHVNPAPTIAATLLESVLTAKPGCRFIFAESLT